MAAPSFWPAPSQAQAAWAVQPQQPLPGWSGGGPLASPYGSVPQSSGPNGFAITSLVCGLVLGLGSVPAVVFGHLSRSKSKREGRKPNVMTVVGLTLGYLGLLFIVPAIAIPAFLSQSSKGALNSDTHKLAAGIDSYVAINGRYPANSNQAGVRLSPGVQVIQYGPGASGGYCIALQYQQARVVSYDSVTKATRPGRCA